jgi:SRSO17 transposase
LYLPREWAADHRRRRQAHVPPAVRFRERWRIGLGMVERAGAALPFGWVAGDDEFGRASAFRAALRRRRLRYVLDVPCNTLVRDIDEPPPPGKRYPPWRRVDEWARLQPSSRWRRMRLGDGAKGPKGARVAEAWVQAKGEGGRCGPPERLVVIRAIDREPRTWFTLSNAPARVAVERLAQVHGQRHGIEEGLQAGKGEVGLAHYEVRSWVGWHHHMTLSLLALWFLVLEKQQLGGENPGLDGAATAGGVRAALAAAAAQPAADRCRSQSRVTPHGRRPHLPLVRPHQTVPAAPARAGRIERLQ